MTKVLNTLKSIIDHLCFFWELSVRFIIGSLFLLEEL